MALTDRLPQLTSVELTVVRRGEPLTLRYVVE